MAGDIPDHWPEDWAGDDMIDPEVRDLCDYDPTSLAGRPIGMFHCPDCGCMIVAGIPHPPCHPAECGMARSADALTSNLDPGDPGPGAVDHREP